MTAPIEVTTWYLEQTDPGALRPARTPEDVGALRIERTGTPSPEFSRFLYTAVGGDVGWTDRLPWSRRRWQETLTLPGAETWVAHWRGTPAGFVELAPDGEGSVEIVYFGLLPAFRGVGLGGHLLTVGTARAWDLASRHPGSGRPTRRVWLHTCSKDGPHALANYRRRGFAVYDIRRSTEVPHAAPALWPVDDGDGGAAPTTDSSRPT